MKFLSKIIATFFTVGYFPIAPGTLTSLIVVLLYKFYLHKLSWPLYLLLLFLLFDLGLLDDGTNFGLLALAVQVALRTGPLLLLARLVFLFQMKQEWFPLLSCFLLFRIFDIIKPYPIRKVETLPEGWGIMMDDLVAAVYAGIIINLYLLLK